MVDLISLDPESDEVVLLMLETRGWSGGDAQLRELEEKFNAYLSYVLDGHLAQQYPQYAGKRVRFRLDCADAPGERQRAFLTAARNFAASENIRFDFAVRE